MVDTNNFAYTEKAIEYYQNKESPTKEETEEVNPNVEEYEPPVVTQRGRKERLEKERLGK